jgi:hypothetical protein
MNSWTKYTLKKSCRRHWKTGVILNSRLSYIQVHMVCLSFTAHFVLLFDLDHPVCSHFLQLTDIWQWKDYPLPYYWPLAGKWISRGTFLHVACATDIGNVCYVTNCDLAVTVTDLLGLLLQKILRAPHPWRNNAKRYTTSHVITTPSSNVTTELPFIMAIHLSWYVSCHDLN